MEESQATVSRWLKAASAHTGATPSLSEDGHCHLLLDDDEQCIVEVPPGSDSVFLYIAISRLPEQPDDAVQAMKLAMALNTFGIETGGSVFSYDPRSDHIVLTLSKRVDLLDELQFCELLGGFIDSGVGVKAKFKQAIQEQGATVSAQALSDMRTFMRA